MSKVSSRSRSAVWPWQTRQLFVGVLSLLASFGMPVISNAADNAPPIEYLGEPFGKWEARVRAELNADLLADAVTVLGFFARRNRNDYGIPAANAIVEMALRLPGDSPDPADKKIRDAALAALAVVGGRAVDEVRPKLKSHRRSERQLAVECLGRILQEKVKSPEFYFDDPVPPDDRVIYALCDAAADNDQRIREAACAALANWAIAEGPAALANIRTRPVDPSDQAPVEDPLAAAFAVLLARALQADEAIRTRVISIGALAKLGDDPEVDTLRKIVENWTADQEVRRAAIDGLGTLGRDSPKRAKKIVPLLCNVFSAAANDAALDPFGVAQEAVAHALMQLGSHATAAAPILQQRYAQLRNCRVYGRQTLVRANALHDAIEVIEGRRRK